MGARLHSGGSPVSHWVTKFPPPPQCGPFTPLHSICCVILNTIKWVSLQHCLGIEGRETIQAGVCPQERDNKT